MDQNGRGLLECPICADKVVVRLPSAPRLNLSGAREPAAAPAPVAGAEPSAEMQARWMQMVRHVLDHTEDVGERFAEEARRIHYREAPERGIRGVASPDEARELADEGIEVFSFPIPDVLKEPVQ